jgi:hypothetical protein
MADVLPPKEKDMEQQNIHTAISKVMEDVGYVKKTKGANLNYTFAGEAALISALRPAMVENGIYMHVLKVEETRRESYTTKNGTAMVNTVVSAMVRFVHAPSGSFIDVAALGEGSDAGDKSANKAMTGLYKYALRQTFCIETGDDPDGHKPEGKAPEHKPVDPNATVTAQLVVESGWVKEIPHANQLITLLNIGKMTMKDATRIYNIYRPWRIDGKLTSTEAAAKAAAGEIYVSLKIDDGPQTGGQEG